MKLTKKLASAQALAPVLLARAQKIELTYAQRLRQNQSLLQADGSVIEIALADSETLNPNSILVAQTGEFVQVLAASEDVLIIWATQKLGLQKAAYEIGLAQQPVEMSLGILKTPANATLEATLQKLEVRIDHGVMPFEPDNLGNLPSVAAPLSAAECAHHVHGESGDHAHHGHEHKHEHEHEHVHGADCGHQH